MKYKGGIVFIIGSCLFILLAGCTPDPIVKGNIYRKGFNEKKLPELHEKLRMGKFAIFPFKGIVEGRDVGIATDGNAIADLIAIQMLYRGYDVLERDKMDRVLDERAFAESDEIYYDEEEHDSQEMSNIGKLLGVDFIIHGSVIQYEYRVIKRGKVALAITITSRIIDVRNGEIMIVMSAGAHGNNLPDALDGITVAFTDALKEDKVYVWE